MYAPTSPCNYHMQILTSLLSTRLNARSSLLYTRAKVPEQAIQPVRIAGPKPVREGENQDTKECFVPTTTDLSITESQSGASSTGSMVKLNLCFPRIQDGVGATVPVNPPGPGEWRTAPVNLPGFDSYDLQDGRVI